MTFENGCNGRSQAYGTDYRKGRVQNLKENSLLSSFQ
jgi:hypothetical protein